MDNFIITTTPTIEGHSIKAYHCAINVNVVIGINIFSDFAHRSLTYLAATQAYISDLKTIFEN